MVVLASFCIAAPVIPGLTGGNEDIFDSPGQINPASLIEFFVRLLLPELAPRPRASLNLEDLVGIGARFLGGAESAGGFSRNEAVQDPRVLEFEQQINRRNQLSRVGRIFSSLLS